MKNFVQPGHMVTIPAPSGGVVSGAGVLVGALFGVAATTQAEGQPVELATTGVYDLPKVTGTAFTLGAPLFWDTTPGRLTTVAADGVLVGAATEPAESAATTGRVRLNGVFGGASAADITAHDARLDALEA
jgi:predicted RecA/RadA family phage recombinase